MQRATKRHQQQSPQLIVERIQNSRRRNRRAALHALRGGSDERRVFIFQHNSAPPNFDDVYDELCARSNPFSFDEHSGPTDIIDRNIT
jgi:hypothetical protein